jgi:cytochrome c-type biogenesis protein CcmF
VCFAAGLYYCNFYLLAKFAGHLLGALRILTSVHAFASDPERGIFILAFLAVVIGGSLLLFALRGPAMQTSVEYSGWSRENLLLINNIFTGQFYGHDPDWHPISSICRCFGSGENLRWPSLFLTIFFVPLMTGLMVLPWLCRLYTLEENRCQHAAAQRPVADNNQHCAGVANASICEEYSWLAVFTLLLALWVTTMSIEDLLLKTEGKLSKFSGLTGSYWA